MRDAMASELSATVPEATTAVPARGRWGVTRMRLRRPSGLLMWTTAAIALIAFVVLGGFDGYVYYSTPLDVRAYTPTHAKLRPSGTVGIVLGVIGLALMMMPLLYVARKKIRALSTWGSIQTWLQVHIFCGIVGPVLITFHTSFKFNGIITVAFWLMVLVVVSGFVGRYLWVRIPRTVRGVELTHDEVRARPRCSRRSSQPPVCRLLSSRTCMPSNDGPFLMTTALRSPAYSSAICCSSATGPGSVGRCSTRGSRSRSSTKPSQPSRSARGCCETSRTCASVTDCSECGTCSIFRSSTACTGSPHSTSGWRSISGTGSCDAPGGDRVRRLAAWVVRGALLAAVCCRCRPMPALS